MNDEIRRIYESTTGKSVEFTYRQVQGIVSYEGNEPSWAEWGYAIWLEMSLVDKDEKILALQRTIKSRESTMDGYNDSLIKKDQEIKSLTELLCHCPDCDSAPCTMQCANITKAYNQGYMLGHNDTVEGVFQDIPSADMDKRQDHHPNEPTQ